MKWQSPRHLRVAVASREVDCAICLESDLDAVIEVLGCGHKFCQPCLSRHIATLRHRGSATLCPVCRRPVSFTKGTAEATTLVDTLPSLPLPAHREECDTRSFLSIAKKLHFKKCPSCGICIQKVGGCPSMRCHCGVYFIWDEAELVAPCNQVHFCWDERKLFCETCGKGSRFTYVRLLCARSVVAVIFVPALALAVAVAGSIGLCITAAVVLMPCIAYGPLVLGYELMRFLQRCKSQPRNPFLSGMASGARFFGFY